MSELAVSDLQVRYPDGATAEEVAAGVIKDCGDDPKAAVVTLVGIVAMLLKQKEGLVRAASPGFARLPPLPRRP